MGLKQLLQILAFFHKCFPNAFYPKYGPEKPRETATPHSPESEKVCVVFQKSKKQTLPSSSSLATEVFHQENVLWMKELKNLGVAIDELNGTIRGLPLGTKAERKIWYNQAKQQSKTPSPPADDDEEPNEEGLDQDSSPSPPLNGSNADEEVSNEEGIEPLERPEDVLRFFFDRFTKIFYYNKPHTIHAVWDYMNRTPAIKGILRQPVASKPVVWPQNDERKNIFARNYKFENSIHDFFADKEARTYLYEYLTTALLERFPTEGYLPEGSKVVVWAGIYKGVQAPPMVVERSHLGVVTIGEWNDPTAPSVEADVAIGYIVRKYMGSNNILILSKDSDFIPILLSLVNEMYKSNKGERARKYKIILSHKITVETRITKEEHEKLMRENSTGGDDAINNLTQQEEDPFGVAVDDDSILLPDDVSESPPPIPSKRAAASFKVSIGAKKTKKDDGMVTLKTKMREIIDINTLYEEIWAWMFTVHKACSKCDPMDAFIAILFLGGCDYIKNPPYVSFKALCHTYFDADLNKKIGCLCPYDESSFRLDFDAFKRLIAFTYKTMRSNKTTIIPGETYEEICGHLRKKKIDADKQKQEKVEQKRKEDQKNMPAHIRITNPPINPSQKLARKHPDTLPPEFPEQIAANLHWVVNYYTRSSRPGFPPTNGLERDPETGLSLHGYAQDPVTSKYLFTPKILIKTVF